MVRLPRETDHLLHQYLQPMIAQNIDALVLGCTYPYLISKIKTILGNDIKIVDSGEAVARQTKKILMRNNRLNSNKNTKVTHQFYTNKITTALKKLVNGYSVRVIKTDF